MLEMDPQVRALWTQALRDGTRVQGDGALHYQDADGGVWKQCCLGVLCELAAKAGVVNVDSELDRGSVMKSYDGERALLPPSVQAWAGLHSDDPLLRPYVEGDEGYLSYNGDDQEWMHCSSANDDEGLTFLDIADLIDGGEDATTQQA
jgi:hypothetical protein